MKKPTLTIVVLFACLAGLTLGALSIKRALTPPRVDRPLTTVQAAAVQAAIGLMQQKHLMDDATLAATLLHQGKWRGSGPGDAYLAQSERSGDTPYAYTLADGKKIIAIVLAPRFFAEATPTGRTALMIHETGHARAYLQTGRSDEYDGYKREYDSHAQLGLTDHDGVVYFAMLDGVVQYVAPRAPAYKTRPDVKAYLDQSSGS